MKAKPTSTRWEHKNGQAQYIPMPSRRARESFVPATQPALSRLRSATSCSTPITAQRYEHVSGGVGRLASPATSSPTTYQVIPATSKTSSTYRCLLRARLNSHKTSDAKGSYLKILGGGIMLVATSTKTSLVNLTLQFTDIQNINDDGVGAFSQIVQVSPATQTTSKGILGLSTSLGTWL